MPVSWGGLLEFGIIIGGWLFFSVWTWRTVARSHLTADSRLVYDYGVLGFGAYSGLGFLVFKAVRVMEGESAPNFLSLQFAGALLQHGFVMFPLALWGGYFWGKGMSRFFSPRGQ